MKTEPTAVLFLRVPRPMLMRIDAYSYGRFATRAEAVRAILRRAGFGEEGIGDKAGAELSPTLPVGAAR
jgi:hypothetical protein